MEDKNIFITEDGSHSINNAALNVSYHSRFGAVQEAMHVFIEAGLKPILEKNVEINIFEMGFGTGLNTLLTFMATEKLPIKINYQVIETDILNLEMAASLNFTQVLGRPDLQSTFLKLHALSWDTFHLLTDNFSLYKRYIAIEDLLLTTSSMDLVYYDAFSPETQPELWTTSVFQKLYDALTPGGALLTYCSKVSVRRAMELAGFLVQKIPGPQGKREIVKALKYK